MKKSDTPIVKKITLDIAGKTLELTQEQAGQLCDALMGLLGRTHYSTAWIYPYSFNGGTYQYPTTPNHPIITATNNTETITIQ